MVKVSIVKLYPAKRIKVVSNYTPPPPTTSAPPSNRNDLSRNYRAQLFTTFFGDSSNPRVIVRNTMYTCVVAHTHSTCHSYVHLSVHWVQYIYNIGFTPWS